jgi:Domain of unknown function (DUF5753)
VAGLEVDASSIGQFSVILIPGLLQTEDYARAALEAIRLDASADDIDRRLEFRLHWQTVLTSGAPEYWVVLEEATVRREVGGPAVMAEQLERLIEVAKPPNVTLQVLPFSSGEHPGMDGDFTILHYRESADPDVVYIENTGGDMYLEAREVTRRYLRIFDHLPHLRSLAGCGAEPGRVHQRPRGGTHGTGDDYGHLRRGGSNHRGGEPDGD